MFAINGYKKQTVQWIYGSLEIIKEAFKCQPAKPCGSVDCQSRRAVIRNVMMKIIRAIGRD
ncbi:MAG: hypothetical protein PVI71_14090, partial [Desulfobacterales bacterium]